MRGKMFKEKLIIFTVVIITLAAFTGAAARKLHTLKISRKGRVITELRVETANTPEERARGLMFRKNLQRDRGMWFVFDEDTSHPFWMENTLIGLDIIFVDNNTEVVSIYRNAEPLSRKLIYPDEPYRYVLEVPAGFADRYGLKVRDDIRLKTAY